jgi:hypothetical protein
MTTKADDGFKLLFDRDGVLIGVDPPAGQTLRFGPTSIARLTFDELRGENITLEDKSVNSFEQLMGTGNITMELTLINAAGRSICGGSCGGRAFCWC